MSDKKLLPCPFCGGETQVESECSWASTGGELMYYVTCSDCGVEGIWHHKKEEAIKAWNTRKPMERIVERLEERLEESCKLYAIAFNAEDRGSYDAYSDAIDIVKEGGLND